jgi:hypothetical protein
VQVTDVAEDAHSSKLLVDADLSAIYRRLTDRITGILLCLTLSLIYSLLDLRTPIFQMCAKSIAALWKLTTCAHL